MDYQGRYKIFNPADIKTYPLSERTNKVTIDDVLPPAQAAQQKITLPDDITRQITSLAREIVTRRHKKQPVIFFTGAHLIKNGLGLLLVELVKRNMLTLVAGNGALAIHDFEMALIGQTSEFVPQALEKGQFGMAYEFGYINNALALGNKYQLGLGETLGKMIIDESFRNEVLSNIAREDSPRRFSHPQLSVLAACYEKNIPCTIHVGIGADVIDQHESFNGQAKGGCSGRDFLIYTNEITQLTAGGVILNVGSAVTGPEILLKAVSMAANTHKVPNDILTADFDLRTYKPDDMTDESSAGYYFRDQKSIVTRVPNAFEGKGMYIRGDQNQTIVMLYQKIMELLNYTDPK